MITNQDIDIMFEKLSSLQHLMSAMERLWLADFAQRYQKTLQEQAALAEREAKSSPDQVQPI